MLLKTLDSGRESSRADQQKGLPRLSQRTTTINVRSQSVENEPKIAFNPFDRPKPFRMLVNQALSPTHLA